MDAHFVVIVGVGTVTAGGTARCDSEHLGGDALGTTNLVTLLFGTSDDLSAGVLEGLDLATTEGHSDLVDVFMDFLSLGLILLVCHFLSECQILIIYSQMR